MTGDAEPPHSPARPPDLRQVSFAAREVANAGRWRQGVAAMLMIAVAGSMAWGGWQLSGRQQASYASGIGQLQTVALADGSTATLSSDSRLEVRMSRGERHVALARGEAFFDVARDVRRPFVVEAQGRRVAAVGTRFSVRNDPEALRVVVTEGKVRLESVAGIEGRAQPEALLPAGSVATAGRNGVLVRSLPLADAERYLQWRDGYLSFDDASLATAAAEFNRFSERKLELGDAAVAELRVGGNFRWSNTEGFVRLLEQGFPVRAERHPDRIVLHSR
jgi:transmembrane sensor